VAIAARAPETEALYREHGAAVAALCRSLLRDRGEAEDATQQVFLSAHRALLNGTTPQEPLAWLLAVARNECYARFRRRAATPVPAGEAADGATADASVHVLRAGELATMWDEVERMPRAQRQAFLLREIRGLSYGQLANELSVSASSVRSLLLRARTRLRHRLGDVAAGLGGAQWVQALLRVAGGGEGSTPVFGAAKVAAVGLGTFALAGAGATPRVVHHESITQRPAVAHRHAETRARRVAVAPAAAAQAPHEARSVKHSHGRDEGPSRSASAGGSDDNAVSESRDDGSASTATSASESSSSSDGSDGNSGSNSGDTTMTTAASTESGSDGMSSGSDSSVPDSSGSSGSDGSLGSGSSDGGGGDDGWSGSD
jgi:RNA polymerase sigma-70 factor (ECF subfamily)